MIIKRIITYEGNPDAVTLQVAQSLTPGTYNFRQNVTIKVEEIQEGENHEPQIPPASEA